MFVMIRMIRKQEDEKRELQQRIENLESIQSKYNLEHDPEPIVVLLQPVVYEYWTEYEDTIELDGQDYLEHCVEAEAGNQGETGKKYVCDVVLNRLDWEMYNSVYEVIDDPGQFQCVSNGSIKKVEVSDETKEVVEEELKDRTNKDITFFKTGNYHYGTEPCFQYGAHYFSKKR